eukprot:4510755-Amphidinium_carterae.1
MGRAVAALVYENLVWSAIEEVCQVSQYRVHEDLQQAFMLGQLCRHIFWKPRIKGTMIRSVQDVHLPNGNPYVLLGCALRQPEATIRTPKSTPKISETKRSKNGYLDQ